MPDNVWVRVVFHSLFGAWLTVTPNAEVGTTSSTISSSDNTFWGTGDCGLIEPGQICEWFALYAVITCDPTECDEPKDSDGDGDIDLKDFAAFQRCVTGPG